MSASDARVRRVYAATRDLIDAIHPGEGEAWAGRLRRRFIAPAAIFESSAHILQNMDIPRADALLLTLVPGIARCMLLERFGRAPRLDRFAKAGEYLKALFLGRVFEHFYMLALDPSGRLLSCVFLQRGTTDSAPFYVRHVLSEVVRTRAHAIVISHNHPNNTLLPSQSDINCTLNLISALQPLGVPLLDHIIVADHQAVSMRDTGLVFDRTWILQNPGEPLLQRWFQEP